MIRYIVLVAVLFMPAFCFSQGTVRGKITDKNGETLIGAAVVLKSDKSFGVTTDFDGNYSIKISQTEPQTLVISYVGFQTIEIIVAPKNNEVIIKNVQMVSSSQNVAEVEVSAKAIKSNTVYTENMKKKSATTIDFVSAETMKKTGDNNVTAAVARVAGVSTNGGFITVRGIGDRYVKTTVNGSRIPTLDPFTNNIKLDLFPASLIDNVLITKTASPDLPGDWAGAYLSVETKDYPDELKVDFESSFGYNNQSTGKEVISSQRSKTDWLGFDSNLRDHDHNSFVNANINPSQYQQFVALGLKDYFTSLGVNEDNWYKGATDYFKLGLIQLGLLAPALYNDANAVTSAANLYTQGNYASEAFKVINANVPASATSFPTNWNTTTRKAPLNFTQSFSVGNQMNVFGRPLGFLAGFRYYTVNLFDPDATANRASVVGDSSGQLINSVSSSVIQQSGIETNGWSALINAAYKLNSNNSISLLFMPNFIGSNRVRKSYDTNDIVQVVTLSQFYEERKQMVYQFKSEHFVPSSKIKIESNASYTRGSSSTPDFKNVQYWINPDSTYQIGGAIGDGIHRYYRYLTENVFDSRLSTEIPLSDKPELVRKLKAGGSYQRIDQKFDQYDYFVLTGPDIGTFENGDVDA
ncbi:MAG TPA: carboxypeptidase-like regulatory domain-containing protein, partial [Bacteroidia bacterium]|nr:carboxypeptidase-like regulatory domain-containing protein [Bacteroidia bacterium]